MAGMSVMIQKKIVWRNKNEKEDFGGEDDGGNESHNLTPFTSRAR